MSVLNPIKAWRCDEHGLIQKRNSSGRCPHANCEARPERVDVVPVEWVTPLVRRAVQMGRRQEMEQR